MISLLFFVEEFPVMQLPPIFGFDSDPKKQAAGLRGYLHAVEASGNPANYGVLTKFDCDSPAEKGRSIDHMHTVPLAFRPPVTRDLAVNLNIGSL